MSTANKTAAFKARARTLDTPSLLLLWDALKADEAVAAQIRDEIAKELETYR
jgi:hypothetical protein